MGLKLHEEEKKREKDIKGGAQRGIRWRRRTGRGTRRNEVDGDKYENRLLRNVAYLPLTNSIVYQFYAV